MSDNWLRYVPTDPQFQPTAAQAEAAEALLAAFLPQAEEVRSEFAENPTFVDPGANWSGVECSACREEADSWWGDAMSDAAEENFRTLSLVAPCCGNQVSLNELHYVWPAAFGRYVLEAMNPNEKGLSRSQADRLAATLGCPVREIPVHL